MHILYEIEHLSTSGGIERILTDKANYIAEKWGWEVTIVILLEEPHITAYPLSPKVNIRYLNIKTKGIIMCVEALWKLNKIVKKTRPDIYVTFQTIGAMSCLLRTHKTVTIYEAHGIRTCMQHQAAMSIAERYADCVVVLTANNAKRYGNARRVEVIPNFTLVQSSHEPDYAQKHCIALGRLDFEKNFSRMIDIWEKVSYAHPDWILDIYGEGVERGMLQRKIEEMQLTGKVILHGVTKTPEQTMSDASIYLMTSLFEGFGLVLIEANACGLPCIAFDCPDGPADIINDGTTGYLIPYHNDNIFIDRLSTLMDNQSLRQQMGEAAKTASLRYHPTPIMSQWLKLFNSISLN